MMNWKGCRKKRLRPDVSTIPALLGGLKKTTKYISQDSWFRADILKWNLPNTNHATMMFGGESV
jgi:hypothetical protein